MCGIYTLVNVIFIASFTYCYGVDFTGTAIESCQSYHLGRQGPQQCTADLLRLVSSYTLVVEAAYMFHIWLIMRTNEYMATQV